MEGKTLSELDVSTEDTEEVELGDFADLEGEEIIVVSYSHNRDAMVVIDQDTIYSYSALTCMAYTTEDQTETLDLGGNQAQYLHVKN